MPNILDRFKLTGETALIMMRTPAGRWGEVDDLCGAAILLASDAGNFIKGQLLFVDGGITANFGYLEGEND